MPIIIFLDLFLVLIGVCYFGYQIFLVIVSLVRPQVHYKEQRESSIAVVICARNEEKVIGNLIKSVRSQNYDPKKLDIWVVADNCSDKTAEVSRNLGAMVVERNDVSRIGKGYAYKYFYSELTKIGKIQQYDAFVGLDADNLLDRNFIKQMNNAFRAGNKIVTGYRNSKNFSQNWVASGSSLWFIRESRMFNGAKMILGITCHVGGTGFLVARELVENSDHWRHHALNEDQEFTMSVLLQGEKVAYNVDAIFYDEQPTTLKQSWRQRIRWTRGAMQVYRYFGIASLKAAIQRRNFSMIDMNVFLFPWFLLVFVRVSTGIVFAALGFVSWESQFQSLSLILIGYVQGSLLIIVVTTVSVFVERKKIDVTNKQLTLYLLIFPFYCLFSLPIGFIAIFSKPDWKPIHHESLISENIISKTIDIKQI
jgi:cellulose synthase/poly-beta-1,6-N-acetylglucosamine synthase-like glycosyltransferase